ncbi:MAG TPA: metallophosphoesterase [Anaeromyxobacteraceae bacterium]|nr:metallophosphoesterase [Anaeromyxobacteraceae bacterium]
MAAEPILYNLFWRSWMRGSEVPVALQSKNLLQDPPAVPAILLYPAFATPAVHVRDPDAGRDRFEVLIAAEGMSEEQFAQEVNLRLKVTAGLDPDKPPNYRPLFADPTGKIEVHKVEPDAHSILKTPGGFRGILHPTFRLPDGLHHFYAVKIAAACLEEAAERPERPAAAGGRREPVVPQMELQDQNLWATLLKLNGPALRGDEGWGTHCFLVDGATLNPAMVDAKQPICAYHPLFVYPKDGLGYANVGHVADLHLNVRQNVLRQSDARVIEAAGSGGRGDDLSPRIGSLINVYSANFISILQGLLAASADLVLVGGDLVDHARNCFPYPREHVPAEGEEKNPGKIWKLVDLDDGDNYQANYQAFADLISFFSIVRQFCQSAKKPVYVVAGNHDAYEHAYGISPRVLHLKRANEGIPADHNLTFYEAILAFGESYGTIKKSFNFNAALFEWYFNVLTPFSDYAVELPRQRLVGLHWGEAEEMLSMPFTGHGVGHLPRADKAATDAQVALALDGFRADKKSILFSHFTFVSYVEDIANLPEPRTGEVSFSARRFSDQDFGTFEKKRESLYKMAAESAKMQCVFTGHSHRKGLYFLSPQGSGMTTEMYRLPMALVNASTEGRAPPGSGTPVIVSDCGGPLPRLNVGGEFLGWGSDRPSGTLARISSAGAVERVVAVPASGQQAVPRLAVALEYLHVLQSAFALSDEVFGSMETEPFNDARKLSSSLAIRITLGKVFDRIAARLASVGLYCKPVGKDWIGLTIVPYFMEEGLIFKTKVALARVPYGNNLLFLKWLQSPSAGRFMSMRFSFDPTVSPETVKRYNWNSPWNFEVDCYCNSDPDSDVLSYAIEPRFESPNFDWRRKLFPEKYQA